MLTATIPVSKKFFLKGKIPSRSPMPYPLAASTGRTEEFIMCEMSSGVPGSCETDNTRAFSVLTEM
jgi:hypothetical protein